MNYFAEGMRIFLDYIDRQFKKNPDYIPHPLIRAFVCAHQGIDNLEEGKCTLGVSQDGDDSNSGESYSVVLEKGKNSYSVKDIRHIGLNRLISIEHMMSIFRLQIHIDRYCGNELKVDEALNILNELVSEPKFQAVGDRWREARDYFITALKEGKIHLPDDPNLRAGMLSITMNMDWYDYPSDVRSLIGAFLPSLNSSDDRCFTVTFPKNNKIEKHILFSLLNQHWVMRYETESRSENDDEDKKGT